MHFILTVTFCFCYLPFLAAFSNCTETSNTLICLNDCKSDGCTSDTISNTVQTSELSELDIQCVPETTCHQQEDVFCIKNLTEEFSLLSSFRMSNCKLGIVRLENIFWNITGLQQLDLAGNEIANIENTLFWQNINLTKLSLGNNLISENAFMHRSAFPHLRLLNLTSNNFTSISEEFLERFPALATLDMSVNTLSHLNGSIFGKNSKLEKLFLSRCQLKIISKGIFEDLLQLKEVDLSGNQLVSIPDLGFTSSHVKLDNIDLSNNLVQKIEAEIFAKVKIGNLDISNNILGSQKGVSDMFLSEAKIEHLSLANNKIEANHMMVLLYNLNFENLTYIDLSSNNMAKLDLNYFKQFGNLKSLHLKHSEIDSIDHIDNNILENLQVLNLVSNPIQAVSPDTLAKLSTLKTLELANCQLGTIDPTVFKYFRKYSKITLFKNPWDCGCNTKKFKIFLSYRRNSEASENWASEHLTNVKCSTPAKLKGKPIMHLHHNLVPTCSQLFGIVGLSNEAEITIIIASACVVLLIICLLLGVYHFILFQRSLRQTILNQCPTIQSTEDLQDMIFEQEIQESTNISRSISFPSIFAPIPPKRHYPSLPLLEYDSFRYNRQRFKNSKIEECNIDEPLFGFPVYYV